MVERPLGGLERREGHGNRWREGRRPGGRDGGPGGSPSRYRRRRRNPSGRQESARGRRETIRESEVGRREEMLEAGAGSDEMAGLGSDRNWGSKQRWWSSNRGFLPVEDCCGASALTGATTGGSRWRRGARREV